jgi:hypothetical protein
MALTLGITGMDKTTETEVQTAFKAANAELGNTWTLAGDESADYVIIDMDSLYGPMSWLRLHAAGRKVIGLTAVDRNQTDFRLPRPVTANDFVVLLSEIARDAPLLTAADPPPAASADDLPPAQAARIDEIEQAPAEAVAMAPAPEPEPPAPEPDPVVELPPDRPLAGWLGSNGLQHRVRLQRGSNPAVLIDPRSGVWHGPATLKPLTPYFEGTLLLEDFATTDAAAWETEAAAIGAAQPLSRLQWLGALLGGHGALLPGNDPDGKYRLTKWPQTEREYPKHFRIATAMMKGPATIAEVADASGVAQEEVADFVNANLATGYAEAATTAAPEPEPPGQKPAGGLFGRIRGR